LKIGILPLTVKGSLGLTPKRMQLKKLAIVAVHTTLAGIPLKRIKLATMTAENLFIPQSSSNFINIQTQPGYLQQCNRQFLPSLGSLRTYDIDIVSKPIEHVALASVKNEISYFATIGQQFKRES
jgi:hypothetical protein